MIAIMRKIVADQDDEILSAIMKENNHWWRKKITKKIVGDHIDEWEENENIVVITKKICLH